MSSTSLLTIVIPWRGDPKLEELCQHANESGVTADFQILIAVDGKSTPSLEARLASCINSTATMVTTTVVQSENGGGPGAARNEGLLHVTTPYVSFADSDDLPSFDALVRAANFIKANEANVLVGGYEVLREERVTRVHVPTPGSRMDEELVEVAGIWRFVYETAYLRDSELKFLTTGYGEDAAFLIELQDRNPRFVVWPDRVYTYRDHSSSARLTGSRANARDLDLVATRLWRLADGASSRTRDLAGYWLVRMAVHQRKLTVLTGPAACAGRPFVASSMWKLMRSSARLHRARRRLRRRDKPPLEKLRGAIGVRQ